MNMHTHHTNGNASFSIPSISDKWLIFMQAEMSVNIQKYI